LLRYIGKRLLQAIPTIIGISILVFVVTHVIPGDPARIMLGHQATEQQVQALREELGLNKPLLTQYLIFFSRALQGDFGRSISTHESVIKEVTSRFPATFELALAAMLFATVLGVVLGVLAAVRQGSFWDGATMVTAIAGVSMPVFWLGLMLMLLFAVRLGVLPASGRLGPATVAPNLTGLIVLDSLLTLDFTALRDALTHLLMPTFTLGAISAGLIARMTRSAMLDVLQTDYVRTARAKGLIENRVVFRHALKNASIPVITVVGLSVGSLLGGAVLTETIFSWPGVGRLMMTAISRRDFPLIQGCVIWLALAVTICNLIVDCLYAFLDPRIRYN
jgi:peptide/nickel transport system permease protein